MFDKPHVFDKHNTVHSQTNAVDPDKVKLPITLQEIQDTYLKLLDEYEINWDPKECTIAGIQVLLSSSKFILGSIDISLKYPTYTEKDKKDIDKVMEALNLIGLIVQILH